MSNTIVQDLNTIKTARDNMKTALEGKGQTVTKDIRTYAEAISNIEGGGSGDVKLFETVEQMQADSTAQEGDLAVVYKEELKGITEESEFDSCIFPNTVVLDEAFSDEIYGSFISTGSDYFNGMIEMSSITFSFDGWGESSNINVQYTSSDGITYTRTDGGDELQEFKTFVQWEDYGEEFNSVIGNFMKISGNYFGGLYEYKTMDDENYCNGFTNFNILEETFEQSKVSIQSLYTAYDLVNNYDNNTIMNALTEIVDVNNINFYTYNSSNSSYYYAYLFTTAKYDGVNKYFISRSNGASTNVYTMYRYSVNLINNTVTKTQLPLTSISNIISYWDSEIDTSHIWLNYNFEMGKPTNQIQFSSRLTETTVSNSAWTIHTDKPTKTLYDITTTQLDATADYVYEKTFYGKNGIEEGTLQNSTINSKEEVLIKTKLYNDISTLDVGALSPNLSNLYTDKTNIICIPNLINTENVTSVSGMFCWCNNLKIIPNFNTSNVIYMRSMFEHCTNLINIPNFDTSNVVNMYYMFAFCNNLTTIPNFNTINVTNFGGMFQGCSNLTTVPNFDVSNATNLWGMFMSCENLTTVPNFDVSNATALHSMFINCTNLTSIPNLNLNYSLNIIASDMYNGCKSLTNVTNLDYSCMNITTYLFRYCSNLINVTNLNLGKTAYGTHMFYACHNLTDVDTINLRNLNNAASLFEECENLVNISNVFINNTTRVDMMFTKCNNLSNASVQNIINMFLNANINSTYKNLMTNNSYSPFWRANIPNSRYSNRFSELTSAGWTY